MTSISSNPLVSVIIPAYNQGPLLARAIESALAQTYPRIEVIVVNDGSPDPITRQTAQVYADRIIYLERENGGVAAARNTGVAVANGELIAWLDQDDVWLPHKVELQVQALEAHPDVALVHSSYYLIDAAGKRTRLVRLPEGEWQALPKLLVEGTILTSSVLMPKQVLTANGLLDPELTGTDDWDLYLRLAAHGYRYYCIREPLAEYRIHAENTATKPDVMTGVWVKMLDKFYALPGLSAEVVRWRGRAYFQKYAGAVALYYGAGDLNAARTYLQKAAEHHPEGITTGRFLQSLIYSCPGQPTSATAQEAIRFVKAGVKESGLSSRVARKLESRARLVLARHEGLSHPGNWSRNLVRALTTDPSMLVDRELWEVAGRLPGRMIARLTRRRAKAPMRKVTHG